jgi:polysaccharide export outer membrane protein
MRPAITLFLLAIALCAIASVTSAQDAKSPNAESPRKCVAVLGAVNAPARFELKRRTRLLEVVAFAGGFTNRVGSTIRIMSTGADCVTAPGDPNVPHVPVPAKAPSSTDLKVRFYRIEELNTDDEIKNPYLEPGDIVVVTEVESAYITGAVIRPLQISLKHPVTLTQALTMAGGLVRAARTDSVRIIRQTTNPRERLEIKLDLNKIRKHREQDLVLQPNDIVEVPFKYGRSAPMFGDPVRPIYDAPPPVRVIYELRSTR